ncbi:hypothetical protein BGZ57DRAFT_856949 [Hyaloscypha finlandica]|nr:hypothetical protein BGZ57DRAFT_856949 [Hyaloscypha finlandica]
MELEGWDTIQNTIDVEGMGPAALDGRDTTTIRASNILELEIPEEGTQVAYMPPDLTFDYITPSSTFTKHGTSLVLDNSPARPVRDRPAEDVVVQAGSARNAASWADEWLCEHPNCGRAFTHRHKLNRHRKYHIKQHKCLEPSCASRQVTFSLEKDLIRHQAKHNGRRFYCHHTKCRNAFGGAKGGFTRQDNLKRHIAAQHP